ncbi:MAG: 2-C-methyl-D-erythritol 2,4-cyclodiphosphate synthase, partial [Victivallales bacterium]
RALGLSATWNIIERLKAVIRIGQGFDVHRFAKDRPCIIGGVKIPFELGLMGHSDADVLAHAVMDAVIGACSLGDIGTWFPDTDPSYENADSIGLLKRILSDKSLKGWRLVNLDSTVIAEKPKIARYVPEIRKILANAFSTDEMNISVKATTTEGMGFCGRGEGIAAMAVVLFEK